jgi:hypothetical protein
MFDVLRRLSSWRFCFYGRCCFAEVSHPQQSSNTTRDTVVPMNVEVPTKYPLSHNDRIVIFEICLHSKAGCSTDQHTMATEMLTRRVLKDIFPTPHSTHSCAAKFSGISARPCILKISPHDTNVMFKI